MRRHLDIDMEAAAAHPTDRQIDALIAGHAALATLRG
jgi:hypothetical protein